ncbi:MAG: UbiD family decarboxylase, partial [Pseudomonadota bacterium]|nr:UbiD family decarboxylase [Pseudomonadota bacterium]
MTIDTEAFRFRSLVKRLAANGEVEIVHEPTSLSKIAGYLEGNPCGAWFRNVGPDCQELAGNIMGSRRRLAMSIGVEENQLLREISKRLSTPIEPVEIGSADAPVQQVVKLENAADLTELPVHLQHGDDG